MGSTRTRWAGAFFVAFLFAFAPVSAGHAVAQPVSGGYDSALGAKPRVHTAYSGALRREDLILRGAFGVAVGLPILYYGIRFLTDLGCSGDDEEFGGLACATGGALGVALLLGGLVATTAGTIMLVKGLRMQRVRRIEPGVGMDARGRVQLRLRVRL